MQQEPQVHDNAVAHRIELTVEGHTAFTAYELVGRQIIFTHTQVPFELQGKGVGSQLARGALDLASERGLDVIPYCPFVAGYIRRHHEFLGLVSPANRKRLQLE
ncbi:MAG TPA: GNAT family N-acetyltransferase [Nitrolancea sp.]|jgi:predicted GNAT family acetyltransferase|nr:GNAT family N-acetyltransferase [Nitrolancea sp.]